MSIRRCVTVICILLDIAPVVRIGAQTRATREQGALAPPFAHLSSNERREFGRRAMARDVAVHGRVADPAARADVALVLERLVRATGYPGLEVVWEIVADTSVNAGTYPGTAMVINSGLLARLAEFAAADQPSDPASVHARYLAYLAAVLGHELAHATLGHPDSALDVAVQTLPRRALGGAPMTVDARVRELLADSGFMARQRRSRGNELAADQAYYAHSAEGMATEVRQTESAVRYQQQQMTQQVRQAQATVASAEAQRAQAAADLTNAQTNYDRYVALLKSGAISQQNVDQQRTELLVAKAKSEAADRQADAQRAALELARGQAEQVSMKRSALVGAQQQRAAAAAQTAKADVRLAYTEIHSPLNGVVDVRAVRAGEVIAAGSPIVTLINPDDLWIRADVEESYIGRIRLGDKLKVRLPSGEMRDGTVFFRGVDAGFATQRDVSRSKRDIKTFEIRLRIDNKDRRLATGMTAYVLLPVS